MTALVMLASEISGVKLGNLFTIGSPSCVVLLSIVPTLVLVIRDYVKERVFRLACGLGHSGVDSSDNCITALWLALRVALVRTGSMLELQAEVPIIVVVQLVLVTCMK